MELNAPSRVPNVAPAFVHVFGRLVIWIAIVAPEFKAVDDQVVGIFLSVYSRLNYDDGFIGLKERAL